MIITITGDPGSGKSTLGEKLAKELDYDRYYIGQIRRDAAKKMGMTLAEYNKYGETHPETDLAVDDYQKTLGETKDAFIIEGRTSWFLIPKSLKIYIEVDPKEGATRIFNDLQKENIRNEGDNLTSVEDVLNSNIKRAASDELRYKKYYNKNCFDKNNFDFVIDTTNLTINEAYLEVLKFIQENTKI
ncbi:MAG: cytidylate kinase family protein [Candidatus Moraniibacteriota bacterium]|jgi:CMP/dCMP kinase